MPVFYRQIIVMIAAALMSCSVAIAAGAGSEDIKYADPNRHFHPDGKLYSEGI